MKQTFVPGEKVAFVYEGKIRVGTVERVTKKVVTLWDFFRGAYRSFSLNKVNRS